MKWVLLGVALILSGCASQTGGLSSRDQVMLQGRVDEVESAQARQKTKIASLEKRIVQLEDMVSMMSRRTSLETREVVKIEPDGNGLSAQFDRNQPAQDENYQDIVISEEKKRMYFGTPKPKNEAPARLRPYENVVTGERLPSNDGSGAAQTTVQPDPADQTPTLAYQEGIDLYRQGNFAEARKRFEKFLALRPEESLVDNALYWIGECFYGEGLYHEAAGYFHRIVKEYPKANKVPDALLKVSLTYQHLGKLDSARDMLRYLMEAFPGTEAARIGREKYNSMVSN